jgi:hypothetical protein
MPQETNKLEEFDKIVNEWKEPEWEFERHEKLQEFTVKTFEKLRGLFSTSLADIEKAVMEAVPEKAFTNYPDTEDGRKARYENSLFNLCRSQTLLNLKEVFNRFNK